LNSALVNDEKQLLNEKRRKLNAKEIEQKDAELDTLKQNISNK
jgi:hypothetical protein